MPYDPEEARRQFEQKLESIGNFTRDIIVAELGVVLAYGHVATVYKNQMTADDVVEMVIIGNKYNMKGTFSTGPIPGRTDGTLHVLVDFRYDGN